MVGGVILFALAVSLVFFVTRNVFPCVWKMKSEENLKSLYCLLSIYGEQFHAFPSVGPKGQRGVRNLFPFYQTTISSQTTSNNGSILGLFQVPGAHCLAFSKNPTIDEFDGDHISYCYNAAATYNGNEREALVCEQGVSNGVLLINAKDPVERPVFRDGVHVLFNNGTILWIPADRNGQLATDVVSVAEWNPMVK